MNEIEYAVSDRGKEYVKKNYPRIVDAVERLDNCLCQLGDVINQFYYNMAKYDTVKSDPINKPLLVGRFIDEMAKAVCYVCEEAIDYDYDNYFVLVFGDVDSVNVVSNCYISTFDRNYFVFNAARQPVGIFPGREYIYKHDYSVEYMLNFIEKIREVYCIPAITPVNIVNPVDKAAVLKIKDNLAKLSSSLHYNFNEEKMDENKEESNNGEEQETASS